MRRSHQECHICNVLVASMSHLSDLLVELVKPQTLTVKHVVVQFYTMTERHRLEIPCRLLTYTVQSPLFLSCCVGMVLCACTTCRCRDACLLFHNWFEEDVLLQQTFAKTTLHAGTRLSSDRSRMKPRRFSTLRTSRQRRFQNITWRRWVSS